VESCVVDPIQIAGWSTFSQDRECLTFFCWARYLYSTNAGPGGVLKACSKQLTVHVPLMWLSSWLGNYQGCYNKEGCPIDDATGLPLDYSYVGSGRAIPESLEMLTEVVDELNSRTTDSNDGQPFLVDTCIQLSATHPAFHAKGPFSDYFQVDKYSFGHGAGRALQRRDEARRDRYHALGAELRYRQGRRECRAAVPCREMPKNVWQGFVVLAFFLKRRSSHRSPLDSSRGKFVGGSGGPGGTSTPTSISTRRRLPMARGRSRRCTRRSAFGLRSDTSTR
jgi:hypothetical protein